MCAFFNFDHFRITLQSSDLIWGTKFRAPSLPLPPLIFSFLQALIHVFLWWWACSWLVFSLKWRLQSSFFLLHFVAIDLQEAKDSIDEEDPWPTSFTWSYVSLVSLLLSQLQLFFCLDYFMLIVFFICKLWSLEFGFWISILLFVHIKLRASIMHGNWQCQLYFLQCRK